MNTNKKKKLSNYNKTILSVVIISAVTGGLVLLENYRKDQAVAKFTEELSHYKAPIKPYSESIEQKVYINNSTEKSISNTDAEQLKKIAKHKLLVDSSIITDRQIKTSAINQTIQEKIVNSESISISNKVDVLFGLSSAVLTPEYKLALSKIAEQIKKQASNQMWQLIGHTDKSGHVLYNLQLAKKRAQNVADFLIEQGVNEKQLKLVTLGEYEATQLTHSTYNKGLRKVEIIKYRQGVDALALKLQKHFEELEQQRIDKERLVRIDKVRSGSAMNKKIEKKTSSFTLDNNENGKTSIALDSETGANLLNEKINNQVILRGEPLVNNIVEQNKMTGTLSNYEL